MSCTRSPLGRFSYAVLPFVAITVSSGATTPSQGLGRTSDGRDTMPAGLHSAVSAAVQRDAYAIKPIADKNGDTTYEAVNRANDLNLTFDRDGVGFSPGRLWDRVSRRSRQAGKPVPRWQSRMMLTGFGYEGNVRTIGVSGRASEVRIDGGRIEYHHRIDLDEAGSNGASIVEWYLNDRCGLEQGFTLTERPVRPSGSTSRLRLDLSISGDLKPVLAGSDSIRLADSRGDTILRYGHLYVFDATDRRLPGHFALTGSSVVSIIVDDHDAVYPVTIDPLFDIEVKLTAGDAAADDEFGGSVSISGDTAIVGAAWNDDAGSNSGSAYIFQRDQGGANNWGEVKKLTAGDAEAGDEFGGSVSIGGDTVIVGAAWDDDAGSNSGSAYIFRRDQGGADNWGQVKKLPASDAAAGDEFGGSVSISGDTAIVGAKRNDDPWGDSGATYIFQRDQGGANNWGEVTKLTIGDPGGNWWFGGSVSISGDAAIVGEPGDDSMGPAAGSAYVFHRDEGGVDNWGEVKKLTASDASGSDIFGVSVSISGDTGIVGAQYGSGGTGSAYIFQRDQGGADNWGHVKKLTASDPAGGDEFGFSVSISGDTAIVGASRNDDAGSNSGSAYVFQRDEGGADNWGELTKLTASDAAGSDIFGVSVSISSDTAIVGAKRNDDAGSNSGSAYLFFETAPPIPTVSQWGLIAMTLLVLTAGAVAFKRRQTTQRL